MHLGPISRRQLGCGFLRNPQPQPWRGCDSPRIWGFHSRQSCFLIMLAWWEPNNSCLGAWALTAALPGVIILGVGTIKTGWRMHWPRFLMSEVHHNLEPDSSEKWKDFGRACGQVSGIGSVSLICLGARSTTTVSNNWRNALKMILPLELVDLMLLTDVKHVQVG